MNPIKLSLLVITFVTSVVVDVSASRNLSTVVVSWVVFVIEVAACHTRMPMSKKLL